MFGRTRTGALVKRVLSSSRACCALGFHTNLLVFFNNGYNGNPRLPSRAMNRLRAAKQPVSFWAPLMSSIGPIRFTAAIFVGLALIPRLDTTYPSNMPLGTPKMHFSGLSLMMLARSFLKTFSRFATILSIRLILITMSSTYASTVQPMSLLKHLVIVRWYVALAFFKPNGIVI